MTFSLSTPSQVPERDREPPPLSPWGFFLHFFQEIWREPICKREAKSLFSGSGFLEGEQEEWGLL